ncbi:MAG TPA: CBS domain-containing protein [Candidatus Bathyarchaeia archaeon]|nr:CBS domain-containing protein [Candidatus Bathyarchaeia archaeon]
MPNKTSDLWWLFSRQTINVTQEESVLDAASLMRERNFRHLPVVTSKGTIVGIISAQDIIDALNLSLISHTTPIEIFKGLDIPVQRIMKLHPIVVEQGDDLLTITKKMSHNNVGALPIVDEKGIIQGIITLRDLIHLIGIGSEPINVPVSELMNTNVSTISINSPISKAVQLMSEKRVRRLPIISPKQELVGMLSNKDLLRYTASLTLTGSPEAFDRKISELMTKEVITISHNDDIRVAASLMMTLGVGGLAINDLPSRKIAIITERDLIRTLSMKRSYNFTVNAMQFELEQAPRPSNSTRNTF